MAAASEVVSVAQWDSWEAAVLPPGYLAASEATGASLRSRYQAVATVSGTPPAAAIEAAARTAELAVREPSVPTTISR